MIRKHSKRAVVAVVALLILAFFSVFHPSRPLEMRHRSVEIAASGGAILRGTISWPRWSRGPLPGVVLVHGSGPLTRRHVLGDTRGLVRQGLVVLAYDKRGAGASTGTYVRQWGDSAATILGQLADDAAAAFDVLADHQAVDAKRMGFFGASQAGWIIPLANLRTRSTPRFNVILSGAAVSTGVEQYYSNLTGDGTRAPRVADRAEVERLVESFTGSSGFDPGSILLQNRVPTLWILGDLDASVPTFASIRVLDSIRSQGNESHTVIRYPNANHHLRDVTTGASLPLWEPMMHWLEGLGILEPGS